MIFWTKNFFVFHSAYGTGFMMIFDCHTHLADHSHIGGEFLSDAKRAWGDDYQMDCSPEQHAKAITQCDGAIVLALDAENMGFSVPNSFVAQYVKQDPRLFGFASVNPNRQNAKEALEEAYRDFELKGLKLAPIYQNFDPRDKMFYSLYAKAAELGMPIMWHQGTSYVQNGPLEFSNPVYLDAIVRAFPDVTMIIAHLGHPWILETVCVVRKQKKVYADISALCTRPWQMYNALISALEYGIGDKLLFGTDFPFFDCNMTIDSLRRVNEIVEGTKLPRVPEKVIEGIINRNTPGILGLA
jgi:predicted TIM-barrel fold metal-dependent hydrolase